MKLPLMLAALVLAAPASAATTRGNFLIGHWQLAANAPARCQGVPALTFTPTSHTIHAAGTHPLVPLSEGVRYRVASGAVTLLDRDGESGGVTYRTLRPGRMQDQNGCPYRRG